MVVRDRSDLPPPARQFIDVVRQFQWDAPPRRGIKAVADAGKARF